MPRLRESIPEDIVRITDIYNQSIEARDSTMDQEPKHPNHFRTRIASLTDREVLLVVEDHGSVQGWAGLERYSNRAGYQFTGETSVYVDRRHVGNRRGYGSVLQQALIERAHSYDYHHLVAKVWADNKISRALHAKFGYELVGVQKEIGYVDGQWQDVAIMQLLLRGEG